MRCKIMEKEGWYECPDECGFGEHDLCINPNDDDFYPEEDVEMPDFSDINLLFK